MYQKLLKAAQWGLLFLLIGVLTGFLLSFVLASFIGPENHLLLPIMLGLVGLIFGFSSGFSKKSRRKKRRKRRSKRSSQNPTEVMANGSLKPFVVKPTESQGSDLQTQATASSEASIQAAPSLFSTQLEEIVQFEEATGARSEQLHILRVCDIRLDDGGEPMSICLPPDAREPNGREVFIVLDHHREAVGRVLKAAMKRDPGNTVARLFE
jgi:hypothetical protein